MYRQRKALQQLTLGDKAFQVQYRSTDHVQAEEGLAATHSWGKGIPGTVQKYRQCTGR
jgi:hypothetical protein